MFLTTTLHLKIGRILHSRRKMDKYSQSAKNNLNETLSTSQRRIAKYCKATNNPLTITFDLSLCHIATGCVLLLNTLLHFKDWQDMTVSLALHSLRKSGQVICRVHRIILMKLYVYFLEKNCKVMQGHQSLSCHAIQNNRFLLIQRTV